MSFAVHDTMRLVMYGRMRCTPSWSIVVDHSIRQPPKTLSEGKLTLKGSGATTAQPA